MMLSSTMGLGSWWILHMEPNLLDESRIFLISIPQKMSIFKIFKII